MKVNINKSSDAKTIICPVCDKTSEITIVDRITIDTTSILLHDAVGEIYLCMNPECNEYLEKVNEEFKGIKKIELIKRQKEITDLLAGEAEIAKARLVPAVVEAAIAKADVGRLLSSTLYTLTAGSDFRRAYSVEEILEACTATGLQPSAVDNSTIPFIVGWLEEHKGT